MQAPPVSAGGGTLWYLHSIRLQWVEETSLFQIQPDNFWAKNENRNVHQLPSSLFQWHADDRQCGNIYYSNTFSPRPHKIKVTGGGVVWKVSSELWNACLVVVAVLGMELHVAVAVQKHQLHDQGEKNVSKTLKISIKFGLTYMDIKTNYLNYPKTSRTQHRIFKYYPKRCEWICHH